MSAPDDDDKRPSVNTGKHIVLKRPEMGREVEPLAYPPVERLAAQQSQFFRIKTEPDGSPFFDLTEEERASVIKRLYEPDSPPSPPQIIEERKPRRARSIPYPDPDLRRWCEGYMRRMKSSRTAMEIVNHWYSTWRGHPEKPKNITKKHKPGHVDRVSKWLERHEKAGRLRVADRRGKWNAKSYMPVEGAEWRRPRKASDAEQVDISQNIPIANH